VGERFSGPAVILGEQSTAFVPPGFVGRVDELRSVVVEHVGTGG
jgi:hypothetical protein